VVGKITGFHGYVDLRDEICYIEDYNLIVSKDINEMLDTMLEEPFKPVLVNIPISLLMELDEVATTLSQTRSHLIRRAITRDLQFITKHELSRARTTEADIQDRLSKLAVG